MKTYSEYKNEIKEDSRKKHPEANAWMDKLDNSFIPKFTITGPWLILGRQKHTYDPAPIRRRIRACGTFGIKTGVQCNFCTTELVKYGGMQCPGCGWDDHEVKSCWNKPY